MLRIDAELLIPGRGEPQRDASVVADGRAITYVGPTADAPGVDASTDEHVRVPYLMPGLWDCHGHFMGMRATDGGPRIDVPIAISAARAAVDVEAVLQAGFTSVREV